MSNTEGPVRHRGRHGRRRRRALRRPVMLVAALVLVGAAAAALPSRGAAAADPTFTASATTGLVDGQTIDIGAEGLDPGVTYVIVECGPEAISIETGSWPDGDIQPEDGCDAQSAYVRFSGNGSSVHAAVTVHVMLNAAVGPIDCRAESCFIALFPLAGNAPLHVESLTFGSDACAAAGSCVSGTRPGVAGYASPRPARATPAPPVVATATTGSDAHIAADAGIAGDLTAPGSLTGEVTGPFPAPDVPTTPTDGEGIVRLDLAAPGTDWGANTPSTIVADVSVDGGPTQQLVLFNGATPFVYAGELGALATGSHTVTIGVNAAASHPGSAPATIEVHDVQLLVVTPSNPRYDAIHYAPILWGRSTSALHDTPLIEYGSTAPSGSGTQSSYTMVFSHEDSGTAFVPFMESGVWGRTTDIESFFSATADSTGTPTGGSFLASGTPDDYPDTENAILEEDQPYTSGVWEGGSHGVVRVASGNNDVSQSGTTAFRFRPVPVPAPGPGEPREAVMDANPWTYRIAGEEVARWYTNFTTDPALPEQGDARQYAYVQLDSSGSGVSQVAIDVQLDGGPTWYANDLGSGYDTGGTGVDRVVIKLPTDWMSHTITAVRIRVFPTDAASSLSVSGLKIFGLDADWGFHQLQVPAPSVVAGFLFVPQPTTTTTTSTTTSAPSTTGPATTAGTTVSPTTTPSTSSPTSEPASSSTTGPSATTAPSQRGAPAATAVTRVPRYTG